MLKAAAAATALAGSLVVALAGTANAAPAKTTYHAPEVEWVHNVKADADSATLKAKYRCWGGNDGVHLWVSLKQGGGITGKTAEELAATEGTSAGAASWYDSHPQGVVCDGRWQIQEFTVDRELGIEGYHPEPWAPLESGPAFLQFCLLDSTADPEGDPDQGFGYLYTFVPVKAR